MPCVDTKVPNVVTQPPAFIQLLATLSRQDGYVHLNK